MREVFAEFGHFGERVNLMDFVFGGRVDSRGCDFFSRLSIHNFVDGCSGLVSFNFSDRLLLYLGFLGSMDRLFLF